MSVSLTSFASVRRSISPVGPIRPDSTMKANKGAFRATLKKSFGAGIPGGISFAIWPAMGSASGSGNASMRECDMSFLCF
jgi:hypothetical protein